MTKANIESPCIRVCAVSGQTGMCLGCGRTLKEIGSWAQLSPTERRTIMDALPARLDQAASGLPNPKP